MNKGIVLCRIVALALVAEACGRQESRSSVDVAAARPEDKSIRLSASLGGISVGDGRAAVMARLGKPIREIATGDALDPSWVYPGFDVAFWDGRAVAHIRNSDAKYCTSSGVCPGSPFGKAVTQLGRTVSAIDEEPKDGRYKYPVDEDTCWLEVTVVSKAIESLEIDCQP